jgi:hypothetical protein
MKSKFEIPEHVRDKWEKELEAESLKVRAEALADVTEADKKLATTLLALTTAVAYAETQAAKSAAAAIVDKNKLSIAADNRANAIHARESIVARRREILLKTAPRILDEAIVELRAEWNKVRNQEPKAFSRPTKQNWIPAPTVSVGKGSKGRKLSKSGVIDDVRDAGKLLMENLSDQPSRGRRMFALIEAINTCEALKLVCADSKAAKIEIDKLWKALPTIQPEVVSQGLFVEPIGDVLHRTVPSWLQE